LTSIAFWSTTTSNAATRAIPEWPHEPTQALRDALSVAELPPLVCPEREEVEPAA
jgi:hypothetical protein